MPDHPSPPDLAEIAQLLRAYDESTAALQATHDSLQREVARLSGELQRKNAALSASLDEVSTLRDYLADIIDNDTNGVVAIDRSGRVIAFNPAAREIVAALAGDVDAATDAAGGGADGGGQNGPEGRDWTEAFPAAARPLGELLARALAERARLLGVELSLPGKDGSPRHLAVSVAPVIAGRRRPRSPGDPAGESGTAQGQGQTEADEGRSARRAGELTGAVGTFQDMTQYRHLAERARRNERLAALGEMAAGVAHEIRNPLGGIELYASNLARQLPEGGQRATCEKIIAATTRLNRIVTDLLSFTRSREPMRRPVRVEAVIRQALDAAAAAFDAKGLLVEVDCARAGERHALDPDLLSQAFLNILLNAAQAMDPGGRLTVTAEQVEEAPAATDGADAAASDGAPVRAPTRRLLRIRFADDGPGVPENVRDKLFNPFFTMRAEGTGLGLAITHKIVGDHDGSITVGQATPRGAVFTIDLPVRADWPGVADGGGA